MNNQTNAFFFQIQSIPDDTTLFDQFQQQNIFYSYFQVEQNYYLFLYSQKFIDIDSIDPFIHIVQELDTKQRKIRSLRGFFLYALEIFERADNSQILKTNLKPSFWRNLKTILRQNKKTVLLQFLFGTEYSSPPSSSYLEDQIQTLKSQVDSLKQRIIQLENNQNNQTLLKEQIQKALRGTLKDPESTKTIQHDKLAGEVEKGPFHSVHTTQASDLIENNKKSNVDPFPFSFADLQQPIYQNPLEGPIRPKNGTLYLEQGNLPSKGQNALQTQIFVKLSNIDEQDRIEIIQKGFQLNQEGKISLKKYYESTDTYSLFQFKGYSIKYDTIRKNKLYQQLKK